MSPTSSFVLLNLPFLALTEVIEKLELKELFLLSFCSKKTHFVAKHYRDKSIKLELELHGEWRGVQLELFETNGINLLVLNINIFSESPLQGCSTVKVEGQTLKIRDDLKYGFDVYCRNSQCGTNILLQYVLNLFNKNIDAVHFLKSTSWMMGMVEKLQGSSYQAFFSVNYGRDDAFTDDEFRDLLIACKATDLHITHSPSNAFRFDNFAKKYDSLCIEHGHWITSENLVSLDCQELIIYKKSFTKQEIRRFLKRWIEGGSPRLKALSVEVNNRDGDEIFSNIEEHMQTIPGEQQYRLKYDNWEFDGKLIRRMDGVMASVQYDRIWQYVRLAAWPDFQGNNFC